MGMVISCDRCERVLTHEAGDKWHWREELCLCSCCDPSGQAESDARAEISLELLKDFKEWREARK